jgi:hypothetical protein
MISISKGFKLRHSEVSFERTEERRDTRVTSGSDEEQASVHTQVGLLSTLRLLLLPHICFMLVVDEVDNWAPRVAVVDIVTKAGGVDDGELDLERLFLELGLYDFNL